MPKVTPHPRLRTLKRKMTTPQYITLRAWAERKFDPVPHRNTLHRWITDGSIVPAPFKLGTTYMVTPDARHVNEPAPVRLVHRLKVGPSDT